MKGRPAVEASPAKGVVQRPYRTWAGIMDLSEASDDSLGA
jgi:hypothetical protein